MHKLNAIYQEQFKTPAPFHCWCHPCERGFMSIAELQEHNRINLRKHREINEQDRELQKAA